MADNRSNYSDAFQKAIDFILPHEEEFLRGHWGNENFVTTENVSGDSGGLTKYGIDQSSHPGINIANLTKDQAVEIYHQEWLKHNLDALPPKIALACFDVWVNGGHATMWLQMSLTALGFPVKVDAQLGPATIAAATAAGDVILTFFINLRDRRFKLLATGARAKFLGGWLQRDVDLRKYLGV